MEVGLLFFADSWMVAHCGTCVVPTVIFFYVIVLCNSVPLKSGSFSIKFDVSTALTIWDIQIGVVSRDIAGDIANPQLFSTFRFVLQLVYILQTRT